MEKLLITTIILCEGGGGIPRPSLSGDEATPELESSYSGATVHLALSSLKGLEEAPPSFMP